MDLNPVVGNILGVASIVVVPIAGLLANKGLSLAKQKFGMQVSATDKAAIDDAVAAGAGVLRAKLAGGLMTVPDVTLGNAHVDQAAQTAMDVAGAAGAAMNITKDQIAARIVGMVGHALGDDPGVPSVVANTMPATSAVGKVAAMGLLVMMGIGSLAACTAQQDATIAQGLGAATPCISAIQAKVASEPSASDAQKALDANTVATTNTSCLAVATDAATLVQQALNPTTPATTTTGTSP